MATAAVTDRDTAARHPSGAVLPLTGAKGRTPTARKPLTSRRPAVRAAATWKAKCDETLRELRQILQSEVLRVSIGSEEWYLYAACHHLDPHYVNVTREIQQRLVAVATQRLQSVHVLPDTMVTALGLLNRYLHQSKAFRTALYGSDDPLNREGSR